VGARVAGGTWRDLVSLVAWIHRSWEQHLSRRHFGWLTMNNKVTVYVRLLGEGVDVWRPVQAEHVADDLYRLMGDVPSGETWSFVPGGVVRCAPRSLTGDWGNQELVLVAGETMK
jgi:hypothetical protein